MAFQKFIKDPDAILDYRWNWSKWLTAITDTIESATFITDDGITVESYVIAEDGLSVKAWISGGELGASPNVTCRITTAGGRTDDRTGTFKIVEF